MEPDRQFPGRFRKRDEPKREPREGWASDAAGVMAAHGKNSFLVTGLKQRMLVKAFGIVRKENLS